MARINTKETPPFPFSRPNSDTPLASAADIEHGDKTVDEELSFLTNTVSKVNNPEWVEVHVDSENNIVWGIKKNGDVFFGVGVPKQIREYISKKIAEVEPENYDQVLAFLSGLLGTDTTLQMLLNTKANTSDLANKADKSSVDAISARLDQLNLAIDSSRGVLRVGDKMYKLIDYTGDADFDDTDYTVFIDTTANIQNPEWKKVITDSDGRVLYGVKQSDDVYWPIATLENETMSVVTPSGTVTASVNSIIRNLK